MPYVGECAAHTITELVRFRTDALVSPWDERRVTIERARIIGGARGRGIIRICAFLPILSGIDLTGDELLGVAASMEGRKTHQ